MKRHTSNTGSIGKRYRWFLTCFLASVVLLFIAMSGRASAAGIIVNSTADNTTGDILCTLREAIINANDNARTLADCVESGTYGADTITFTGAGVGLITLTAGDLPPITDVALLTIDGGSLVTISGDKLFRVFFVFPGASLTLENLTVKDGRGGQLGGGGVLNDGTVTITNSTLSGNLSLTDGGGGITNNVGGTVTITDSTLSGNSAPDGGGGGILNDGTLTITNSTLSGNSANDAGGIDNNDTATITNSIVANNSPEDCENIDDTFTANGNNLDTDGTCPGFGQVTSAQLNLGPLFFNGGPTKTHALLVGSFAINTGVPALCTDAGITEDQRGETRDGACDIGAYEFITPPPPPPADLSISKSAAKTVQSGKQLTYTINVTNNGPNPASAVVVNDVLPTGTSFVSLGTQPVGEPVRSCITPLVGATGTVSCSYASLGNGSSITLVVKVKITAKGNTQLNNTATVTSSTTDPNLANNSATATSKLGK